MPACSILTFVYTENKFCPNERISFDYFCPFERCRGLHGFDKEINRWLKIKKRRGKNKLTKEEETKEYKKLQEHVAGVDLNKSFFTRLVAR